MSDAETLPPEAPMLPVSPHTGLDPEIRMFVGRLLTGYESAHRTIRDMAEMAAKRANQAEEIASKSIATQLKLAEEREEFMSRKHKRDLEEIEAREKAQGASEIRRDFRTLLTLAVKRYVGIPLTGNDSHGLQDLLATMTPEQLDSVMSTGNLQLSDAQRQALASTLMSLAEAEAKKLPEAAE